MSRDAEGPGLRPPGPSEDRSPARRSTLPRVQRGIPRDWFHRNPCHPCGLCTSRACFVFNPDGCRREIHICWRGCDGLPPGLLKWAA